MSKYPIPSKTILVGPHLVNEVSDLRRLHGIYLDVSGASYKVLGTLGTTFLLISRYTTTPASDFDFGIKVLANDLQDGQQLSIYRVEPAAAVASKLSATKVRR